MQEGTSNRDANTRKSALENGPRARTICVDILLDFHRYRVHNCDYGRKAGRSSGGMGGPKTTPEEGSHASKGVSSSTSGARNIGFGVDLWIGIYPVHNGNASGGRHFANAEHCVCTGFSFASNGSGPTGDGACRPVARWLLPVRGEGNR
jgi:hypothetical protein